MENITIIVPVHKINSDIKELLSKTIDNTLSIPNINCDNIMVIGPNNVIDECKTNIKHDITYVINENNDFCTQVNIAVKNCKTKYFSILEFDDFYKNKWFDNFSAYLKYNTDVSVFLPLTELVDENRNVVSYINETVLASSFSNELGFLDLDCLQVYMDFNVTGGIINRDDFIEVGGLKPSLKIASWYEFLMRLCHNGKKIYVIPKVGYSHLINRKDSFMENAKKEISLQEGSWLIKTAQQEYFFKDDRNKKFSEK